MDFEHVCQFRVTREATDFADGWLKAQRTGDVSSDFHMNLLAWIHHSPGKVLAITLNLIDRVGGDEDELSEPIGLGPVDWLIEKAPESFGPVLQEAVGGHAGFELYTRWKRANLPDWKWLDCK